MSCQGSGAKSSQNALESVAEQDQPAPVAQSKSSEAVAGEQTPSITPQSAPILASAVQSTATPQQCAFSLAGGPPPVPPRGADFGEAVMKNTGKAVQRGIIQQIGGAVAGGLGAAVAGGVAQTTIRQEEDIKGVWLISDGSNDCACEISVDSFYKLKGKGADTGNSKTRSCNDPLIRQVEAWQLGYAFAGYGAKFELKKSDKQSVLATMTRQGIHYFSGTLADGRTVTMWRDGQTYSQLTAFNKSLK